MQDIITPINDSLFSGYEELIKNIDALCSKIHGLCGRDMHCSEKCDACCIAGISLFPIETFYLEKHISTRPEPAPAHEGCVFLKEGLCTVYPFRPVVCRTQGYPLLYESDEDDEGFEVSFCHLNFTETPSLDSSCLVDMERINTLLAALNISFLKETGLEEKLRDRRFTMEEIAGDSIYP